MATWAALIFGGLIVVFVPQDAFEVMLLPTRVQRRARMVRVFFRTTWSLWTTAARVWPPGDRRERFLSIYGALSMMILFILWAGLLIMAFGLIQWALQPPAMRPSSLGEQTYKSGVTFFTLGFGDVVPRNGRVHLDGRDTGPVGRRDQFGLLSVAVTKVALGIGRHMKAGVLEGRRILVVEDEEMIAMLLEDYLMDLGCEVAGHATTVAGALGLVEQAQPFDAALLDMNLCGELVTPVANALSAAGIPFCFMTGLGADAATGFAEAPTIGKPFDQGGLRSALIGLFSKAEAAKA